MQILGTHVTEFGRPYLDEVRAAGLTPTKAGAIGADPIVGHLAEVWRYHSTKLGRDVWVTVSQHSVASDGYEIHSVVTDSEPDEADWRAIWRATRTAVGTT